MNIPNGAIAPVGGNRRIRHEERPAPQFPRAGAPDDGLGNESLQQRRRREHPRSGARMGGFEPPVRKWAATLGGWKPPLAGTPVDQRPSPSSGFFHCSSKKPARTTSSGNAAADGFHSSAPGVIRMTA